MRSGYGGADRPGRPRGDAGLLLPWTSWWDEASAAVLFPDAEVRAQVEREQQQLPVSYFEGSLPAPHSWDERRAAYLAFGDTYATEQDEATQRGWLVSTLRPATQLHMLIDPDQTVTELVELIRRLGFPCLSGSRETPATTDRPSQGETGSRDR